MSTDDSDEEAKLMLIFEEVCFIFSASAYSFRDLTRPLTRDSKEAPGPQVDEDGWMFLVFLSVVIVSLVGIKTSTSSSSTL